MDDTNTISSEDMADQASKAKESMWEEERPTNDAARKHRLHDVDGKKDGALALEIEKAALDSEDANSSQEDEQSLNQGDQEKDTF